MSNVFITGDAYVSPTYGPLVAIEMLRAVQAGDTIIAVDFHGYVPMLVQDIAKRTNVPVELVKPAEGQELDVFHQSVIDAYAPREIVMIHDEPMVSTVYQSLARVAGDDQLRLVSVTDLMV